ncbi:hypothetical protein HY480_03115, partial [Candidatus Uhrbacteria bacterium]|nr:hypothetical protein [Candidatus Uhrbacteria bacterium]
MTQDMDLLSIATLKTLCARAGMRPQRASGQHFLVNARTLAAIVAAVDPQPTDTILEIGAGFGVLTTALALKLKNGEQGGRMIAIERDRRVTPILHELVASYGNVEVVEGDVLQLLRGAHATPVIASEVKQSRSSSNPRSSWPGLLRHAVPRNDNGETWKLVANLPYGITSEFLRLLFDRIADGSMTTPERVVLLLQREVVDRLTGQPKSRGFLTMLTTLHGSARRVTRVPASHFWPSPKVESAVVAITDLRTPDAIADLLDGMDRTAFLRLVHGAFVGNRRRQLTGALAAATGMPRERLLTALHQAHVD